MYLMYQFSENEDPSLLSQTFWRLKISHRIVTNQEKNEIWINNPDHQKPALQLVKIWLNNPTMLLKVEPDISNPVHFSSENIVTQIKNTPATVSILLAAIIVAFITQLGANLSTVKYFTISSFQIFGGQIQFNTLSDILNKGEYWRLLTPALIHFSVMHIVFNALWIWHIGRRVEQFIGSIPWLINVVVIAIFSNILQFQIDMNPLFGGLSGVVYGLIGFAWLIPLLRRDWPTIISKTLMTFFVVWLAIGYTHILESIGLGRIANTTHLIGLCTGFILGFIYLNLPLRRY